jgi:peptidoglycan biosynthesis protein MviN/MurJ (putative lipid II flippase)
MSLALLKQSSNAVLGLLGLVAVTHSLIHFGTGELPEAVLALLLFLKAFSDRRQPWTVVAVGVLAVSLTWIVNAVQAVPGHYKGILSWLGIAAFAVLAFSRYILERSPTGSQKS